MPEPVGSPTLVGREQEQAVLSEAVRQAALGSGGIVVLAGDPGIGKSRLALDAAEQAVKLGLRTAWGYCTEHFGAPPFWPWVQTLGELDDSADTDTASGWISQANLRAVQLLPALSADEFNHVKQHEEPAQSEFELLDSAARFLVQASQQQPICIVLEDLHWADQSTLNLLRHLGSDLSRHSILVIGTYRDIEVSRLHPLADTLSDLQRNVGFHRIPMRPLDDQSATALMDEVAGDVQPAVTRDAVLERTGGNPLFVLEIARELARGDYHLEEERVPEGIREAIGRRLNRLSNSCTNLLTLAALVGREFSHELMHLVLPQLDQAEILDDLEEAVGLRIIEELPGRHGNYRFSHALIQQTLTTELSLARQDQYHAQIAESMERLFGLSADSNASVLAHHFRRAEKILGYERALHYSMLAAKQALSQYAIADAHDHFQAALEIHGRENEDATLAEILFGLGQTSARWHSVKTRQEAWNDLEKAFDIFTDLGDTQMAIEIAKFPFLIEGVYGEHNLTSKALEFVIPGSIDHGWVLARHGIACADAGENKEAIRSQHAAIEIAKSHGDERLLARALAHLSQAHFRNDDPQSCLDIGAESIDISRGVGDPFNELRLTWFMARAAVMSGYLPLAKTIGQDSQRAYERLRHPVYKNVGVRAQWLHARVKGRFDTAIAYSEAASGFFKDEITKLIDRSIIGMDCGTLPAEDDLFELFESILGNSDDADCQWFAVYALASLAGHRSSFGEREIGLLELGRQILENLKRTVRLNAEMKFDLISSEALFVAALEDKNSASDLYPALALRAGGVNANICVDVNRILGRLAATSGNDKLPVDHFEKARNDCRDDGFVLELGWSCYDFSAAVLQTGTRDPDTVRGALEEGLEIAERIGAAHLRESLQLLVDESAEFRGQTGFPGGLSEREVEVLRLLTEGRTNQEIADALVISRHTVVRHVNNIYSKINVKNRAGAGAWAHRAGLLGQDPMAPTFPAYKTRHPKS